jgi:hypothetical protein
VSIPLLIVAGKMKKDQGGLVQVFFSFLALNLSVGFLLFFFCLFFFFSTVFQRIFLSTSSFLPTNYLML